MQNISECLSLELHITDEAVVLPDQFDSLLKLQQDILEMIVLAQDKNIVLNKICALAEAFLPNAVASIMLVGQPEGLMSVEACPKCTTSWNRCT